MKHSFEAALLQAARCTSDGRVFFVFGTNTVSESEMFSELNEGTMKTEQIPLLHVAPPPTPEERAAAELEQTVLAALRAVVTATVPELVTATKLHHAHVTAALGRLKSKGLAELIAVERRGKGKWKRGVWEATRT